MLQRGRRQECRRRIDGPPAAGVRDGRDVGCRVERPARGTDSRVANRRGLDRRCGLGRLRGACDRRTRSRRGEPSVDPRRRHAGRRVPRLRDGRCGPCLSPAVEQRRLDAPRGRGRGHRPADGRRVRCLRGIWSVAAVHRPRRLGRRLDLGPLRRLCRRRPSDGLPGWSCAGGEPPSLRLADGRPVRDRTGALGDRAG